MTNIYEAELFSRLTDYSMHPGGLRLTDRAVRLAGLNRGMAAADIGCGAGATAAYLNDQYALDMTGLDISESLISRGLTSRPELKLLCRDGKTPDLSPDSLDAVLFECTLSVIGADARTLDVYTRALRPGGTLIVSDIFARRAAGKPDARMTSEQLADRLRAAGLDMVHSEDHTPALITYIAELKTQLDGNKDADRFLCEAFDDGFKVSECAYRLIIARKPSTE